MKTYNIKLTSSFLSDLEKILNYFLEDDPIYAQKLFGEIEIATDSLKTMPFRCPNAYEADYFKPTEVRQLLCSNYRIIFTIDECTVVVLTILSCKQDYLSTQKIDSLI